jgi:hypothetical protein
VVIKENCFCPAILVYGKSTVRGGQRKNNMGLAAADEGEQTCEDPFGDKWA